MKRYGLLAVVAALAGAGGCASSGKYVVKHPDDGVVAVPDDTDTWPNYNRQEALKLIEQHVGPDYEIVSQQTVNTGRTPHSTLPDTNERLNARRAYQPAYQTTNNVAMPETTQFQITYRRKDSSAQPFVNDQNYKGVVVGGPAGGAAPAPGVQPAGGATPGAMASPFNRPAVPAAPGTPGCDS